METKHKKLTSKAGLTIPKDIRLAAGRDTCRNCAEEIIEEVKTAYGSV